MVDDIAYIETVGNGYECCEKHDVIYTHDKMYDHIKV